jgi:site-specific DNA-methyltransferase (adenine-specific)
MNLPVANPDLDQWFTPVWSAELIVHNFFPNLGHNDLVLEPSCGAGSFLRALPEDVPAVGVEIDPRMADVARELSGRDVVVGDFRTVPLDIKPTVAIGNPPFSTDVFDGMLARLFDMLPADGRAGFLVPAYFFQTPGRVLTYNSNWGIEQTAIPRTLFPGITKPLVFAVFGKTTARELRGFALYQEAADIKALAQNYQDILNGKCRGSIWEAAVRQTVLDLGGRARLQDIYAVMERRRPTGTPFWREKIRQVCARIFERCGDGVYAQSA